MRRNWRRRYSAELLGDLGWIDAGRWSWIIGGIGAVAWRKDGHARVDLGTVLGAVTSAVFGRVAEAATGLGFSASAAENGVGRRRVAVHIPRACGGRLTGNSASPPAAMRHRLSLRGTRTLSLDLAVWHD